MARIRISLLRVDRFSTLHRDKRTMNALVPHFYPGSEVDPGGLIRLAQAFREAAARTRPGKGEGGKLLRAPFDLLCLHSIELAMTAALRSSDYDSPTIRAMGHNLARRARALEKCGITWRRNTIGNIEAMSHERHYLKCRYAPSETDRVALSRVEATADEALEKCAIFVAGREAAASNAA